MVGESAGVWPARGEVVRQGPRRVALAQAYRRRYETDNRTIREIAAETGRGYSTVWLLLREAETPLRSLRRRPKPPLSGGRSV